MRKWFKATRQRKHCETQRCRDAKRDRFSPAPLRLRVEKYNEEPVLNRITQMGITERRSAARGRRFLRRGWSGEGFTFCRVGQLLAVVLQGCAHVLQRNGCIVLAGRAGTPALMPSSSQSGLPAWQRGSSSPSRWRQICAGKPVPGAQADTGWGIRPSPQPDGRTLTGAKFNAKPAAGRFDSDLHKMRPQKSRLRLGRCHRRNRF